mmetsp:Transcript_104782/g.305967  ORF Transcript_104782/g.305967 Transcript_104782/m.305967 type:complete len:267 (+) Transcript_104782:67-867(+)
MAATDGIGAVLTLNAVLAGLVLAVTVIMALMAWRSKVAEAKMYWAYLVPLVAAGTILLSVPQFAKMPILFLGHIAAMSVCWCLMTSGSVLYQMTRAFGLSAGLRAKARMGHALSQTLACIAAVIGYACIYANHSKMGQSQFGFDPGNPIMKTVHALLGYPILIWLLLQACQGWQKYFNLSRWLGHKSYGRIVVLLTGVNIGLVLWALPLGTGMRKALQAGFLSASGGAFYLLGPMWKAGARELPGLAEPLEEPALYVRCPPEEQAA